MSFKFFPFLIQFAGKPMISSIFIKEQIIHLGIIFGSEQINAVVKTRCHVKLKDCAISVAVPKICNS